MYVRRHIAQKRVGMLGLIVCVCVAAICRRHVLWRGSVRGASCQGWMCRARQRPQPAVLPLPSHQRQGQRRTSALLACGVMRPRVVHLLAWVLGSMFVYAGIRQNRVLQLGCPRVHSQGCRARPQVRARSDEPARGRYRIHRCATSTQKPARRGLTPLCCAIDRQTRSSGCFMAATRLRLASCPWCTATASARPTRWTAARLMSWRASRLPWSAQGCVRRPRPPCAWCATWRPERP